MKKTLHYKVVKSNVFTVYIKKKEFLFINFTANNKHWCNAGGSLRAWTKEKKVTQKIPG